MNRERYLMLVLLGVVLYALSKLGYLSAVFSIFGPLELPAQLIFIVLLLYVAIRITRSRTIQLGLSPIWTWLSFVPIVRHFVSAYLMTKSDPAAPPQAVPSSSAVSSLGARSFAWWSIRKFFLLQLFFWPGFLLVTFVLVFIAATMGLGPGNSIHTGHLIVFAIWTVISVALFTGSFLLSFVLIGRGKPNAIILKLSSKQLWGIWFLSMLLTTGFIWFLFFRNTHIGPITVWPLYEKTTLDSSKVSDESSYTPSSNTLSSGSGLTPESEQTVDGTSITITSPNGGETLKIGDGVQIRWTISYLQPSTFLDLELFKISGTKTIVGTQGECLNCVGGGLRSGVLALSPLANGTGNIEWIVGKMYSGGFVSSGNNYIMKATISKTGNPDECPKQFPTCTVELASDWSDAAFSLSR